MPFLHPFLLWGLAFLAVPLILLFLNRKRLILYWAAYEWMRTAIVRRRKRIQLDDILKLIAKILLIIAIVLMITRPFIRMKGERGYTLIIVDNSPSMGVTLEDGIRLDKAKKILEEFIENYESDLAMCSFDGKIEPVVADYTDDKKILKDGLKSIDLGKTYSGATTLFDEIQALQILKETKRIYMVGDFQAHWYANGARIAEHMKALGKGYPLVWHQIDTRQDIQNGAIQQIEITPDGAFLGRECFIRVHVLNGSDQKTGDRTICLYADGNRKARVNVRLEPKESREIPFSVTFTEPGRHNISATIDSDIYEKDDVQYAVVDVPPALRVLAVVPQKGENPFDLDIYVRAALRGLIPEEHLTYESVTPLELTATDLSKVDILLTVATPLDQGLPHTDKVKHFVERGGGLLAMLPANRPAEATGFGIAARVMPQPCHINEQSIEGTYLAFMNTPELKPENINFVQSLIFNGIENEEARLVVEDGVNAFSREVGRGRIVIMGFVPYQGYGDLHFNPNYVQMLLRAVWEARNQRTLYSVSGKFEEWKERWLNRDNVYTLHDEKNNAWTLAIDGLGEKTRLLIPPDLEFGFYSIREDGKEKVRFGYNMDAGDSHMEPVSDAELSEPIKEGLTFTSSDALANAMRRIDLLPLTIVLLLAAIAFEAYAHFFRSTTS